MSRVVTMTASFPKPKKGVKRYSLAAGDWVVCGKNTLMVLDNRVLDGYVRTSDGLYWHPSVVRRATCIEMLAERRRQRRMQAAEWLEAAQAEAKRRGLKVPRGALVDRFGEGMLPLEAATAGRP